MECFMKKDTSLYNKEKNKLNSKKCLECMGLGYIDNADIGDISYDEWECPECVGTGYDTILPRPDADKALKKMIKILTPDFMENVQLKTIKEKFLIIPSSEIIVEDCDEGVLILRLFKHIVICITHNGFAWIKH